MEHCAKRHVGLLQELRYVTREVGSLADAMALPREVRQWWISEMQKEAAEIAAIRSGKKTTEI